MDWNEEAQKAMAVRFGFPIEMFHVEDRSKGGHDGFFQEWKTLWWKPVPEGCGTSMLEPMEPSVIERTEEHAVSRLQFMFHQTCNVLRNAPRGRKVSLEESLRGTFRQNERIVNVMRREDGSCAAMGMNYHFSFMQTLSHRLRDVTIFTYVMPIPEDVAQQLVKEYASVVAATMARVAEERRVEKISEFFKTLNSEVARRWKIPVVSSEEANAGIMAFSDQGNGTARSCPASILNRDPVTIFGTSLLGDRRLESGVRMDDENMAIALVMNCIPNLPKHAKDCALMDVIQLKDGMFVLRMLSIVNHGTWPGGGDRGENWVERDLLIPVTEEIARASVEAVRIGFENLTQKQKTAQIEQQRIRAMKSLLTAKQLDENSVAQERSRILVREGLDKKFIAKKRRDVLLAEGYTEAEIKLFLERNTL